MMYGLSSGMEMSQREIGQVISVTPQRVGQLKQSGLKRLRKRMVEGADASHANELLTVN